MKHEPIKRELIEVGIASAIIISFWSVVWYFADKYCSPRCEIPDWLGAAVAFGILAVGLVVYRLMNRPKKALEGVPIPKGWKTTEQDMRDAFGGRYWNPTRRD